MSKQLMLNGFLAVTFVFLLWINTFQRDFSHPNLDILPDMAQTPAYAAFSKNPNFPNGQTIQLPVPGTIARGHGRIYYDATDEEALRAGVELTSPIAPDDQQALKRGEFVYTTFCTPCHGATGLGDGMVSMRGFPPPPSLLTGDSVKWADGHLFHIITYGGKNMSSYAYQVNVEDRWKVIGFIRSMQEEAGAKAGVAGLADGVPLGKLVPPGGMPVPEDPEVISVVGTLTDEGLVFEDIPEDLETGDNQDETPEAPSGAEPTDTPGGNQPEDEDAS